jgi:hypothetical protein
MKPSAFPNTKALKCILTLLGTLSVTGCMIVAQALVQTKNIYTFKSIGTDDILMTVGVPYHSPLWTLEFKYKEIKQNQRDVLVELKVQNISLKPLSVRTWTKFVGLPNNEGDGSLHYVLEKGDERLIYSGTLDQLLKTYGNIAFTNPYSAENDLQFTLKLKSNRIVGLSDPITVVMKNTRLHYD